MPLFGNNKYRAVAALIAVATLTMAGHPVQASDTRITGKAYASGEYSIAGHALRCRQARTVISAELDDYGAAVPGTIVLNPKRLARLPVSTRLFIYAHECGHQIHGPSEAAADCYAANRGAREGWLAKHDIPGLCGVFPKAMASSTHGARGARCAVIRACFAGEASPSRLAGSRTYQGALQGFGGR